MGETDCNNIEEKKKAGSKKLWNLIAMKWITSVAPVEFSWMMNALKTLQCTPANSDARKAISNTLFINLSGFDDPGKALERLSTCLLFIQKRMDQSPRKWGQASSNVGRASPAQLAGTSRLGGGQTVVGSFLETEPLSRIQLGNVASSYYNKK